MKRIISDIKPSLVPLCVATVLLAVSSCKIENVNFGNGEKIAPSGNIVKNDYPQQPFDEVEVDVVANVKFIQTSDSSCHVTLSAPDNYVDLFAIDVHDSQLNVKFSKKNVNIDPTNVDVTIYSPALHELENKGVANVEIDRLVSDKLKLENSGVGKLFVSGLTVDVLDVECSGVGSVLLSGKAGRAELECSGVGGIEADDLKARHVEAEVSGVGGIRCYASESIKGEVSGIGALTYGGKPQQSQLKRTGVGKIEAQ